ncbi:copper amine oxidase 1 [Annulohypoxylon maeteangense]|uniref:copper amine oxidase 1 n=1 Tax=Annulohypoxylon maeteangense TaxID=1927788 RepID=UPI0020081724|nr:copper amine oxidase 1 [Annulohypoxylon maeteangense]KAI0883794.1 copper amine oxidase 1 [Annulohypoxylon maeteangense]
MAADKISTIPHPLRPLTPDELSKARDIVIKAQGGDGVAFFFRSAIFNEPKREDLTVFLAAEHEGRVPESIPPREVHLMYDVIKDGKAQLHETVVDINAGTIPSIKEHEFRCQTSFTSQEFGKFQEACVSSDLFKSALEEFTIPENFAITIDPWPYGGPDPDEDIPRTMQGLVYARDSSKNNIDSNHYAYPLPIIPIMDVATKKLVRVDRLATGGRGDSLYPEAISSTPKPLFGNNSSAEYVPELLDIPFRTDMKPINITQPEGASFKVHGDNLVEWQKWRFRVGFTLREGAVLHDVCYDNRPVMYRLSFSEMTVPYGDPRPPFHRKQAFDFGDGGIGRAANNLKLGCDCLGAIHYFDSVMTDPEGKPDLAKNVICLHEQDNGIGWKHTNFRTNRAVVTRMRELVVQFVATLANYEYVFAYKLDTAGGITFETRATGIVSVVPIDEGKTSAYGNIVNPGVLAQNHQHIFAVRIDPAMDSYETDTAVVLEESHPIPMNPETNPYGNGYEVRRRRVERAGFEDAEPKLNRVVRLENPVKKNSISGKNVGYKLVPSPTQLLLADEKSVQAARAPFARHHLWFTGHRDGELWAAGEFTNQAHFEEGGVKTMVERGDWFVDGEGVDETATANGGKKSTPVVWSVFGLTHNPRVEDWPVMPVEIHQFHLRPADFFTSNPALDIPSTKNETSVLVPCYGEKVAENGSSTCCCSTPSLQTDSTVQRNPASHLQGSGPDIDPNDIPVKEKRRLSSTLSNLLSWKKD